MRVSIKSLLYVLRERMGLPGSKSACDQGECGALSPYAKTSAFVSPVHGDHFSLLATIEDGLGLPRIGSAVAAKPLSDYFPAN